MAMDRSQRLRDLCAHVDEDDGLDPRLDRNDEESRKKKVVRKDEQLAKLAWREVEAAMNEMESTTGRAIRVQEIEVRGGGTHLVVMVEAQTEHAAHAGLEAALVSVAAHVRGRLARVLNRKKSPTVALRMCAWLPPVTKEMKR